MTPTDEELQRFEKLPKYLKKVAALLAIGLSSDETAQKLDISVRSVWAYKKRLHQELFFEDSLKLAVYIIRHPQIEKMLRESL